MSSATTESVSAPALDSEESPRLPLSENSTGQGLLLVVLSMRWRACSLNITMAQQGELLQPFCGALNSTSTPAACMSTQIAPEAMQSSTNKPP